MDSRRKGLDRLRGLRQDHAEASAEMAFERGRFDQIREDGPTVAVSAWQLFQTPAEIAAQMVREVELEGRRVLEPSAGLGRIVKAVQSRKPAELVCVEMAPQCAEVLYRMDGFRLVQEDFLACDAERLGGMFDAVVMNPPFRLGTDVKHIRHAFGLLRPGGKLVSLCFDGVKQNRDLRPWADTWEVLPAGAFKAEGTKASVAMLTKEVI